MKNGNKRPGGTESFLEQVQHIRVLRSLFLGTEYSKRDKNASRNIQQLFTKSFQDLVQNNGKCAGNTIEVLNKQENNCILILLE